MTKRFLIALAVLALCSSAYAQIGGTPGISGPITGATIISPTLTGNVTATSAVFQGATPLCFDGATVGTFKTCFAFTDPAGSNKTITFPNLSGTAFLLGAANTLTTGTTSYTLSAAVSATPYFYLADVTGVDTTFLSFTNVADPLKYVKFTENTSGGSAPELYIEVAKGAAAAQRAQFDIMPNGINLESRNNDLGYRTSIAMNNNYIQLANASSTNAFYTMDLNDDATDLMWLEQKNTAQTQKLQWFSNPAGPTMYEKLINATDTSTFTQSPTALTFEVVGAAQPSVTVGGVAATDPIKILPVAKGAGAFTGTITSTDLTGNQTWTIPDGTGDFVLAGETTHTWDDTGDGADATFSWDPLPGQTIIAGTCNDAQACDLVVGETYARPGMRFTVYEAGSGSGGHIKVMNNAGVINTKAGADLSLAAVGGAVDFCYIASVWVQCSPLL